jgi:protein involved in polysaccharide export with SLBB domain
MWQWLRACVLGITLASLMAACAPTIATTGDGAAVTETRSVAEYRLGPADKVKITVFGEAALTGEFLVGGNGKISMPLIGDVQAAGLTITMLQDSIANSLRQGYINSPRVSGEIMTYRPFFILGEVGKPGQYPFTNNLTVLNAVATAQGFTYRANTKVVYIKRAGAEGEQAYTLTTATQVAPGDTIRIGERYF